MQLSAYRSFTRQALNYFARPHDNVPSRPIDSPAAWKGGELQQRNDWHETLTAMQRQSILTAVQRLQGQKRPLKSLGKRDLPLAGFESLVERTRHELQNGRGFQLIRGVPVDELGAEGSEIFFWCLGLHLGIPGAQNPQGDLLGHVIDNRTQEQNPTQRLYQTNKDIGYHCDAADVVGLLCLRKAKSGGMSRIVSSVTVFNQLVEESPRLARRLFAPFHLDLRGEAAVPTLRIEPCRFYDGHLQTFYHTDYFRSAFSYAHVGPMSSEERELLDRYEQIAHEKQNCLDMDLAPGDVQLISNHTILHARTGYEDDVDMDARRHLLRLWLSYDSRMPLKTRIYKQMAALRFLWIRARSGSL